MRIFISILLVLVPYLAIASPPVSELEGAYRFLISERDQGGILYTATAGTLQGRQLPLSFFDSAAYWGEHVCAATDCAVVDHYNPQTHTLTPIRSSGGDLQTERVNAHNGSNIYDAATWQIAVMLGRVINRLPLFPGQDAYALVSGQNLLLHEGYYGNSRHPVAGATRATTAGPIFVYNQQTITNSTGAYSFRMLPRTWLAEDPFVGTPYARNITTSDLPPLNPDYQAGAVSWTDWKPITGENAWSFFIGPLQAAHLHYLVARKDDCIPLHDQSVQNALAVLPAFAAMQSKLGAVYYAPAGTVANQGEQLVDPYFASVENNISLYAGLTILRATLENTLQKDKNLAPADRAQISAGLQLSGAMLNGGTLGTNRETAGLRAFFKDYAWQNDAFVQGGVADNPGATGRWLPVTEPKAVDVNTWGVAALGPKTIDTWFGFGASYRNWQAVKGWGGYGMGRTLWGVGFSNQDGNGIDQDGNYRQGIISAEWTAGALTTVRSMIKHYQAVAKTAPNQEEARRFTEYLRQDERSMLIALEKLRIDTYAKGIFPGTPAHYSRLLPLSTTPYLYASKRYLIPFGWYANPIPSTCATAWMIMVANGFNPFVPVAVKDY